MMFLMHRVELKVLHVYAKQRIIYVFLMHRVELKDERAAPDFDEVFTSGS